MDTIYTDHPVQAAADHLAFAIKDHLAAGNRVLWLLSGGSGINVVLAVSMQLQDIDLSNLYVTLTDERYGPTGHPDENWQQLIDGGMALSGATLYRPLVGENRTTTTDEFGAWLMQQFTAADYTIGLFGVGPDGHTAGVKPHSSAATATAWADSFDSQDFERITITPFAIEQLDEAVIQASGVDKIPALKQLVHESIDIIDQPAQVLKTVPKCTLYTDNKGV
ncbi:MAG TPA: 6-phosphogluconolactonase [Candidatus Saccharimonadales bacterium]|nr:6-phosphogluconolactonase [Candidatus Saccharimonadales bacterium]